MGTFSERSIGDRIARCRLLQTGVMAITDRSRRVGETSIVNMVQRVRKNALFEPGDTK
jgi:hypothetical protein